MRMSRVSATLLLLLALCAAGCRSPSGNGRVIVLGLDGMDPQAVDLLMSEGKMPNFAKLRQEGAYGRLTSRKPLLSPIIWTTIATGKTPEEHRIGHFVAVNEKTGEQLPVTSQMRKTKALWNIFSASARSVGVVGWWATWPAETVRGAVVSDHTCYHFLFAEGAVGAPQPTGIVYPQDLAPVIQRMVVRPGDLKPADVQPFATVSAEEFERPFAFNDELGHLKWALATARTYERIGLHLWEQERPDLLMVYIEGTDSVSHLFGHLFRASGLVGQLAEQQRRFGGTVEAMYEYADRIVGDFVAAMDDRTTLVVLSDHGFNLGTLAEDPSKLRDMRRVSEKHHRMEGILYVYGNGVKPRTRIDGATILDIAPTVLALGGLSPAADMPGRVLAEALTMPVQERTVASYEGGEQVVASGASDSAVDPAIVEHLRSLGYLDADSPKGDRNLAAIQFEAGRYAEAAAAYEELLKAGPNDAALRTSLAGVYGALGRYEEALQQLEAAQRIEPLNPETYHNRGAVYERQGKRREAIEEYSKALRYDPQYQPSKQALARLTGQSSVGAPRNDAERLATEMAEKASLAARKGDYKAAMAHLDEAQRIAPNCALVYQYRANVAFLMNDPQQAIAALRKGLEIEPDNALFRTNLDRLEKAAPTPEPTSGTGAGDGHGS
jgi:tetratricopeptide (TPR) repeat protein